jgi:hypothetical protein
MLMFEGVAVVEVVSAFALSLTVAVNALLTETKGVTAASSVPADAAVNDIGEDVSGDDALITLDFARFRGELAAAASAQGAVTGVTAGSAVVVSIVIVAASVGWLGFAFFLYKGSATGMAKYAVVSRLMEVKVKPRPATLYSSSSRARLVPLLLLLPLIMVVVPLAVALTVVAVVAASRPLLRLFLSSLLSGAFNG